MHRLAARDIEILVGTNDLTNGGKYYKAEKLTAHENYNKPLYANDIAVIKLQGKIEFSEKVQPIELGEEDVPAGSQVQLTGWGLMGVRSTNIFVQYISSHIHLFARIVFVAC